MNDYDRKFQAAIDEATHAGIWEINANPPLIRLLKKIGLNPKPPHYGSIWTTSLGLAIWFGSVWGTMMWFALWRTDDMPLTAALVSSLCAGTIFGVLMAIQYMWGRKKHNLSKWNDL